MHRLRFVTVRMLMTGVMLLCVSTLYGQAGERPSCPASPPDVNALLNGPGVQVWEDGIYLLDETGQTTRLSDARNVSRAVRSEDGQIVAYIRNIFDQADDERARLEIWTVMADGSNDQQLVSTEQLTQLREEPFAFTAGIVDMEWIPGTHNLALNTGATPLGEGIYNSIADDLWTVNADTGELTNLLPQGEGGRFTYAPDGRLVVIQTPQSIWMMNADGGKRQPVNIANYAALGMGHGYAYPPVAWLNNDTVLVAVNAGTDPYSQNNGQVDVWRVSTSDPSELISSFPAAFMSFRLSPDGQYAAYWQTDGPQSNIRDLHIAAVDDAWDYVFLTGEVLEFDRWLENAPDYFLFRPYFEDPTQLGHVCGESFLLPLG